MYAVVLALVSLTSAASFAAAYVALDPDTLLLLRHGARRVCELGTLWPRAGPAHATETPGGKRELQARVVQDMPAFLHMLTLGLSAGLSFDASLELYYTRYDTPLSAKLRDASLRWRMGVCSRSDALEQLADELQVPAWTRFVSTVTEALAFGAPLAQALERQAKVISDEQRALVEAQIERMPVKMLVPLATLIVPAMLIAILGPLLAPALSVA